MTHKALVVDDDQDIVESVIEILESLGHSCDTAESIETARKLLEQECYTYVLLDLEIPMRVGRNLPRIQNGQNLLHEIVQRRGGRSVPFVIVMTAHGTDSPDLAVELMKDGAVDYVTKPFKTTGKTLDSSIREAIRRFGVEALHREHDAETAPVGNPVAENATTFSGGEMVFYEDRVTLLGIAICRGKRSKRYLKVLQTLTVRRGDGQYTPYSGEELAAKTGITSGPSGVVSAVRAIRQKIKESLAKSKGILCGDEDVILSTDEGYRFSEAITISWDNSTASKDITDTKSGGDVRNVRDHDVPDVRDDTAGARRAWILQELSKKRRLKAPDVEKHFECSLKTAQRDLTVLKKAGKIKFVGPSATGYYSLVGTARDT